MMVLASIPAGLTKLSDLAEETCDEGHPKFLKRAGLAVKAFALIYFLASM